MFAHDFSVYAPCDATWELKYGLKVQQVGWGPKCFLVWTGYFVASSSHFSTHCCHM